MEKFVPGFCINRFLRIIGREVFFLLDNGYMTADQLDLAVKASIIPRAMVLGFVQRYDFTGLDLSYGNLQNTDFIEPPIDNQPEQPGGARGARASWASRAARASSTTATGPASRSCKSATPPSSRCSTTSRTSSTSASRSRSSDAAAETVEDRP